jgi:hypothetical protein
MKIRAIALGAFVASVMLDGLPLKATTVFPQEEKCPVCAEKFIVMTLGSYSNFGEPARDLSDHFFFGNIRTCPYCLYSALIRDFNKMSFWERRKIRGNWPPSTVSLMGTEREGVEKVKTSYDLFEYILAREAYLYRKRDDQRAVKLLLSQYYATKHDQGSDLSQYYRKEVISHLEKQVDASSYKGKEEAVMTYLLGELCRLDNQDHKALRYFKEAEKLAGALPLPRDEDDERSDWIGQWAYEQSCRILYKTNTIEQLEGMVDAPIQEDANPTNRSEIRRKIAFELMTEKKGPIGKNTEENGTYPEIFGSEKQAQQLKEALSGPPGFPLVRTEGRPGETLATIAEAHEMNTQRLLELNPHITDTNMSVAGKPVLIIKTPLGWTEKHALANLSRLILETNTHAIAYFIGFASTLGPYSADDCIYQLDDCLQAMAETTSFWVVPELKERPVVRQQELLHDCLIFLQDPSSGGSALLKWVDSTNRSEITFALSCFEAKKDDMAKETVLNRLKKGHDQNFHWHTSGYLGAVATTNDLPILKQIAKLRCERIDNRMDMEAYYRKDFEEIIKLILLKDLKKRTLQESINP